MDEAGEDIAAFARHAEFWLEDGNIVLIADRAVAFRVHRSVLARKAGVFRDMFSFPQPDASSDHSFPVLHLSDAPEDLAYFLDAIYNGMQYRFSKDCRPSWAAVKALLLLGNKYGADELQDEATRCLRLHFPKNIEDWDAVHDDAGFVSGKKDVLAIEIANLCRFLRLPEFHLPALYLCCTLPTKTLKQGALLDDGCDERAQLNADDLAVCMKAKKTLRKLLEQNLARLVDDIPSEEGVLCHDEEACDATVRRLQHGGNWPHGIGSRPYSALDSLWWIIDNIEDLCNNCTDYYHARYADIRQDVRDKLGSYIVVPRY